MRLYPYSFSPIAFHFSQSPRDFVVDEIPLYEPSGEGEHLLLRVRKKSLTTQELIKLIASSLGCKAKEIGYAGLKDKHALTTQYLSIPASLQAQLSQAQLEEKGVKILSCQRHHNKIRIGHLKGNAFFIRLKKIAPQDLGKIQNILEKIAQEGIPNYFGYQRFGQFGDNYLLGEKLAKGESRMCDKKLSQFLISSYQSHLFNQWLAHRIKLCKILRDFPAQDLPQALKQSLDLEISRPQLQALLAQRQFFKLLDGDILHHYPYGKLFFAEDSSQEAQRFIQRDITICGLLSGVKAALPSLLAWELQKPFWDQEIRAIGSHRFAWIFPQNLQHRYIPEKAQLELSFNLPKGSYATILLEALANQEIKGGLEE